MGNELQVIDKANDNGPQIVVLKFADSAVPVFKETRNKDYIKYGDDNKYPEYLTYLFNKSAKHNAILTGKANYIFGNGYETGDTVINRNDESLNDISKKAILDGRIYAGHRLEVIWDYKGVISEIYHVEWNSLRKGKDGGFWFKENWDKDNRDEPEFIPSFDPGNRVGSQIFEYLEYRPGLRFYPLPDYIGANNYIETDIEISKFHLSAIRNGMAPSKMIQFFTGEPTEEKKREIEGRLTKKFTGAEKAGKMFLVFNQANSSKSVEVNDLSGSDLDKQFDILNKTCQQEIFSGHLVTSPMLFGIKTEGQLGGNTELKTAYEIFINTYAKPKAESFDREMNWLLSFSKWPGDYELKRTDPIGLQFSIESVIQMLPKQFIFEKLGIPEDQWGLPAADGSVAPVSNEMDTANEHLRNLTSKQHQQLQRTISQYKKGLLDPGARGTLTEAAARMLLKSSLGLSDDEVNSLLDITPAIPVAMSFEQQDEIIGMFDACGDDRDDYEIVKSKKVSFSTDKEAQEDEEIFKREAFIKFEPTKSEQEIIRMYRENESVSVTEIKDRTGLTESYINSKIEALIKRGYIERTDSGMVRVPPEISDLVTSSTEPVPTQIFIKYSYEGPQDSRNRPFCAKLMALNRLYSRLEIEAVSQRLGYSVFDRRGGFWTQPDGTVSASCRHTWRSNIVVKKGGNNVN